MAARGIMQGVGDGMFEPALPLTRAEFAAIVVRAEGWQGSPGPGFADVPAGAWYHADVEAAAGQDAVEGTGPGTFSPDLPMSRAMVATLLARVLGLRHVADDESRVPLPSRDAAAVPAWAHGGVAVMTHLGVMRDAGGAFRPGETVTRAAAAVILDRMLSLTPQQVEAEGDRVARAVHVVVGAADLAPGGQTRVSAYAHDAAGYIIPAEFTWGATGGTIAPTGLNALFTAGPAGTARVSATVPRGPTGGRSIAVLAPTSTRLSASTDLASAGTRVTLTADVLDQHGHVDAADSGSRVVFSVAAAAGGPATPIPASDSRGVATATWTPETPGTYAATAAVDGITSPPTGIVAVAGTPYHLAAVPDPGPLKPGVAVPLQLTVEDSGGQTVAASVPLSLASTGGVSVSTTSAYLNGGAGSPVSLSGTSPGTGSVTVSVPGGAVAPATLSLDVSSLGTVVGEPAGTVAADQTVTVRFRVLAPAGAPSDRADGRTLDVAVTTPGGNHPPGFHPTIHNGTASFSFAPILGGRWSFKGDLPGYITGGAATLQVTAGPVTQLVVDPVPTSILLPGQRATLRAWLGDRYGNPANEPLQLDETLVSGPGALRDKVSELGAPGAAAVFTAAGLGVTRLRFSVPGRRDLAPVDVTMRTVANVADKVAGKGMWLLFSDWRDNSDSALLAKAQKDGITHLYLEVDTSVDGFYGARALDDLLRKAHAAGIAVIDWVYPYLKHPQADIAAAQKVIAYRAPDGSEADGLAADVEENMAPAAVQAYAQAVRQALGAGGPFVGVVYPPDQMRGYPYASLAPYVDVWAPMDYWYVTERDYTYASVYLWVQEGMRAIDSLSGRSGLPFDPALQAFDELPLSIWDPPARQLEAADSAALANGAVGVSFYRWGTADAAQWGAIRGLSGQREAGRGAAGSPAAAPGQAASASTANRPA